jgi:hypothetical protein
MRIALLLPLLLLSKTLAAQPAADAAVPQHVAHLLDLARSDFRDVRGEVTSASGTTLNSTIVASRYVMRFGAGDARSELWVNPGWNVLHVSWLHVAGDRAAAAAEWARLAEGIAAVIPAGWRELRMAGVREHVTWMECDFGGRQVTLQTSLPFQAPALELIVYKFDAPCPARASAAPGA